VSIIIKDTIPGSGKQWHIDPIKARWEWLNENFTKEEYVAWYGGLKSDDFYIRFKDDQHASIYKLKWRVSNTS
jgi:hypothetical protein